MVDNNKYITEFRKLSISKGEATRIGDYKKNNKAMKKFKKIYELFETEALPKDFLLILLKDENVDVRLSAAARMLELNYETKLAEVELKKIEKTCDIDFVSFEAKMVLKVWKERGFLKF